MSGRFRTTENWTVDAIQVGSSLIVAASSSGKARVWKSDNLKLFSAQVYAFQPTGLALQEFAYDTCSTFFIRHVMFSILVIQDSAMSWYAACNNTTANSNLMCFGPEYYTSVLAGRWIDHCPWSFGHGPASKLNLEQHRFCRSTNSPAVARFVLTRPASCKGQQRIRVQNSQPGNNEILEICKSNMTVTWRIIL